jgi:hypothetical protein
VLPLEVPVYLARIAELFVGVLRHQRQTPCRRRRTGKQSNGSPEKIAFGM